MKKLTVLLMAAVMVLSLAACKKTDSTGNGGDQTDAPKAEAVSYKVTYNMNDGNTGGLPEYQFLGANFAGLINYDSRLYIDLTLNLDGVDAYELVADCYVIEADKRQEVGAETGIGQTWTTTSTGTYTDNGDGTITIAAAKSVKLTVKTDTYSSQMKDAVGFSINGSTDDGEWDSADTAELLAFVPETVFTVADGVIVSYADPNAKPEEDTTPAEEDTTPEDAAPSGDAALAITSDDQGTRFDLYADGTYAFVFESYDITDVGTYTYADGVLTITDKNGVVSTSTADGDNIKFHYVYSDSDQLTGDYTAAKADIDAALN